MPRDSTPPFSPPAGNGPLRRIGILSVRSPHAELHALASEVGSALRRESKALRRAAPLSPGHDGPPWRWVPDENPPLPDAYPAECRA